MKAKSKASAFKDCLATLSELLKGLEGPWFSESIHYVLHDCKEGLVTLSFHPKKKPKPRRKKK